MQVMHVHCALAQYLWGCSYSLAAACFVLVCVFELPVYQGTA